MVPGGDDVMLIGVEPVCRWVHGRAPGSGPRHAHTFWDIVFDARRLLLGKPRPGFFPLPPNDLLGTLVSCLIVK